MHREHIEAYRHNGFLILEAIFSQQQVNDICAQLSRLVKEADTDGRHPSGCWMQFEKDGGPVDDPELLIRKFGDFALYDRYFWQLQQTAGWRDAIEAVCPQARLLQSMGMVKPASIGSAKDWHQDAPYFAPIIDHASDCCGIWIALDQATVENGCMQVVPGSHRRGIASHIAGPTGFMYDEEETERCRQQAIPIELAPGSALLFHACLDHFTDHNRSDQRRRAIQYHYAPGVARWIGNDQDARQAMPALSDIAPPYAAARI